MSSSKRQPTKNPRPNRINPKKVTRPAGPLPPMLHRGSSKQRTHPSPEERIDLIGRSTKSKIAEIKRKGP